MNNKSSKKKIGTESEFGYEWNIYRELLPIYKIQFENWIKPFKINDFKNKSFIDAGCGIGRNSYWPLKAGARSCFAFDFDHRTVSVAKENLKEFNNVKIEYLSIDNLKIKNQFDIAFSIGVIHHLLNPKLAVQNLYNSLKKDGTLIIWVYAKEGNEFYLFFLNIMRRITTKLPLSVTKYFSQIATMLLWLFLRFFSYNKYLKMIKTFSFRHLESIVFDQLFPSIANYWTKDQVLGLIDKLNVKNIKIIHKGNYSWTLICDKK